MPGVEILHSSEVLASGEFNTFAFATALVMCVIIGFIGGMIQSIIDAEPEWLFGGVFIGIVTGLLFGVLMGSILSTPEKSETYYKVLVSDEVSMNEFLEHYEIVDQEGKIYTVKDKEGVE